MARRWPSVLVAAALGLLAALVVLYHDRGFVPGDAFTYLAAGERLNAGHALYALGPGDRLVALNPPYWTVPLLSPPFMAVVWRPLAALPAEAGVYLWWGASVAAALAVVLLVIRRRPVSGSLALLALALPFTYEIGVGNVNALLLAGAVSCWWLGRRGRAGSAGVIAAVMVAAKITPLPVAAWIVGVDRRRGLAGVTVGLIACAAVSLLGAGIGAHTEYLAVARETGTTGLSMWSLGGIARAMGIPEPVPTLLPVGTLFGSSIASLALAMVGRPAAGYVVAIVGWTFGSPVVNVNTLTLLFATLAPVAWPWAEQVGATATGRPSSTRRALGSAGGGSTDLAVRSTMTQTRPVGGPA